MQGRSGGHCPAGTALGSDSTRQRHMDYNSRAQIPDGSLHNLVIYSDQGVEVGKISRLVMSGLPQSLHSETARNGRAPEDATGRSGHRGRQSGACACGQEFQSRSGPACGAEDPGLASSWATAEPDSVTYHHTHQGPHVPPLCFAPCPTRHGLLSHPPSASWSIRHSPAGSAKHTGSPQSPSSSRPVQHSKLSPSYSALINHTGSPQPTSVSESGRLSEAFWPHSSSGSVKPAGLPSPPSVPGSEISQSHTASINHTRSQPPSALESRRQLEAPQSHSSAGSVKHTGSPQPPSFPGSVRHSESSQSYSDSIKHTRSQLPSASELRRQPEASWSRSASGSVKHTRSPRTPSASGSVRQSTSRQNSPPSGSRKSAGTSPFPPASGSRRQSEASNSTFSSLRHSELTRSVPSPMRSPVKSPAHFTPGPERHGQLARARARPGPRQEETPRSGSSPGSMMHTHSSPSRSSRTQSQFAETSSSHASSQQVKNSNTPHSLSGPGVARHVKANGTLSNPGQISHPNTTPPYSSFGTTSHSLGSVSLDSMRHLDMSHYHTISNLTHLPERYQYPPSPDSVNQASPLHHHSSNGKVSVVSTYGSDSVRSIETAKGCSGIGTKGDSSQFHSSSRNHPETPLSPSTFVRVDVDEKSPPSSGFASRLITHPQMSPSPNSMSLQWLPESSPPPSGPCPTWQVEVSPPHPCTSPKRLPPSPPSGPSPTWYVKPIPDSSVKYTKECPAPSMSDPIRHSSAPPPSSSSGPLRNTVADPPPSASDPIKHPLSSLPPSDSDPERNIEAISPPTSSAPTQNPLISPPGSSPIKKTQPAPPSSNSGAIRHIEQAPSPSSADAVRYSSASPPSSSSVPIRHTETLLSSSSSGAVRHSASSPLPSKSNPIRHADVLPFPSSPGAVRHIATSPTPVISDPIRHPKALPSPSCPGDVRHIATSAPSLSELLKTNKALPPPSSSGVASCSEALPAPFSISPAVQPKRPLCPTIPDLAAHSHSSLGSKGEAAVSRSLLTLEPVKCSNTSHCHCSPKTTRASEVHLSSAAKYQQMPHGVPHPEKCSHSAQSPSSSDQRMCSLSLLCAERFSNTCDSHSDLGLTRRAETAASPSSHQLVKSRGTVPAAPVSVNCSNASHSHADLGTIRRNGTASLPPGPKPPSSPVRCSNPFHSHSKLSPTKYAETSGPMRSPVTSQSSLHPVSCSNTSHSHSCLGQKRSNEPPEHRPALDPVKGPVRLQSHSASRLIRCSNTSHSHFNLTPMRDAETPGHPFLSGPLSCLGISQSPTSSVGCSNVARPSTTGQVRSSHPVQCSVRCSNLSHSHSSLRRIE